MIPRRRSEVGVFGNVESRVRHLSNGATPAQFLWGGYGLNTQWQQLAVMSGWSTPDTSKRLSVRVRSDVVKFKGTVAYSGSVVPSTPVCILPPKYCPNQNAILTGEDNQGALVQIKISSLGVVTIPRTPVGTEIKFNYLSYPRG